jgi:hypothetical protein
VLTQTLNRCPGTAVRLSTGPGGWLTQRPGFLDRWLIQCPGFLDRWLIQCPGFLDR